MKFIRHIFLAVVFCFFAGAEKLEAQVSPCDSFTVTPNPNVTRLWSYDNSMYLVNMQDTAGVFQIYVGNAGDSIPVCISLNYPWSFLRPWAVRNKFMVQWHPTQNLIICGVEKEFYPELLYVPYNLRLGWLASGIWLDVWCVTPDGADWYNLAQTESGFTGPAFTPDGSIGVWAEAKDSANLAVNVFGEWRLNQSGFVVNNNVPSFSYTNDITPAGARWLEPGNFAPDGRSVLLSADIGLINAEGQDQYILDIVTGSVTNITNSPMIWDEHGVFSPDGTKILMMSSYPYQADTNSYHTLSIKTEFMLMNPDGSGMQQLTHFCDTNYYPVHPGIAATGVWGRGDSCIYAQSLVFPFYNDWIIRFDENCGSFYVGVPEDEVKDELKIFPNPVADWMTVEVPEEWNDAVISLTNVCGQELKTITGMNGKEFRVPVADLSPGLYLLRVRAGEKQLARTFVR